jgi:hypothetical protein
MPKYFQRRDFTTRSDRTLAGLGTFSLFDPSAASGIDKGIRKNLGRAEH